MTPLACLPSSAVTVATSTPAVPMKKEVIEDLRGESRWALGSGTHHRLKVVAARCL